MRKINNLVRLAFLGLLFFAVSCEKLIEYIPGKPKNCRIKKMHFHDYSLDYLGDFYYNKWGNPDSVIFGFVATGSPNMYFKYNNKKQLTQAKFSYLNGSNEGLHRFGYTNGVITTDTTYNWPSNEEPVPLNYHSKTLSYFEYDDFGRIIKRTIHYLSPSYPPSEWTYSYDENGNLVTPVPVQYDNYTNFLVLHPVWQFLEANYSRNNPLPAISYNNFRLPLKFEPGIAGGGVRFFGRGVTEIEYDCK